MPIMISLYSFLKSGSHLLSHTVSSAVSSAAYVLTIVFGMGTGVSHKRIATRNILLSKFKAFSKLLPESFPQTFLNNWTIKQPLLFLS